MHKKLNTDKNGTKTFADAFIKNVKRTPENIAISDDTGTYTYRELNLAANKVANKLISLGIGTGDIIPILVKWGKEFAAAFLGVLKAGATFVPLDINYPVERIHSIVDCVNNKLIIDDEWMKELPQSFEDFNMSNVHEVAMIVFTSGSSGRPKGVVHTNHSLYSISESVAYASKIHKEKRYANILPPTFTGGLTDYLSCFFIGAPIFVAPENIRKNYNLLVRWLQINKINGFRCLPSIAKYVVENNNLDGVEWIELLGEKAPKIKNNTSIKLVNHYGNSECGSCAYSKRMKSFNSPPPIGKPILGISAYILDTNGMIVPKGDVGELCFAGPQVAKGYWQLPELTAEKFVPCPFLPGDVTMYKTGDLARYREDGNIELVGRKDFQIKIRGYRIEPEEIENVATRFEGIDAVVVVTKELGNEKQLVLYYTSKAEIEEEQLKEHLSRFLADYMVPTFYVHLDEMPRNTNGKIDRSALPAPALTIKDHISEEQITNIERSLLDEIKQELQIQDLGLDDDLLSVGFTSLSSMFVQTRLEQKGINFSSGGVESYKVFLKFRTIRKVAKYLENDNN